jgi:hypothetical protein
MGVGYGKTLDLSAATISGPRRGPRRGEVRVVATSPLSPNAQTTLAAEKAELPDLLARADFRFAAHAADE